MKNFIDNNFLLTTKYARELYHEHAQKMPIIDYHCHLPPDEISMNKKFENLTKVWLEGDHYKWRAMRANGIEERYCTGDASDQEKFEKWAETVPFTLRNPLYHWTHLELKRYFGIEDLLNPTTAKKIYDSTSEMLQQDDFSVRSLLEKMNVEVVCTTDDPTDTLEHHQKIRQDEFKVKVLPTWRPDKAMVVEDPVTYNEYIEKLSAVADTDIKDYNDLLFALQKRHDFFHETGCRISDHGLETFYAVEFTQTEINTIFKRIRSGKQLVNSDILKFKSAMLVHFALMDNEKGWTQQFHVGALRNNRSSMFEKIGPDKGFDSIGDFELAKPMSKFFDRLDKNGKLAKTILYNLNPRDNELMATMAGNFNDGSVPGKMQYGSGWWFLDQKDGMEKQMNALSNMGLLSLFVGMLTDSRSFLSYPRHEYFRRILCNLIGKDVANGELPEDMEILGKMVENICYNNAKNYFRF
ncbi:MAG: glucuronate isomerase [Bacteroidales bacterium]